MEKGPKVPFSVNIVIPGYGYLNVIRSIFVYHSSVHLNVPAYRIKNRWSQPEKESAEILCNRDTLVC